MRLVPVCVLCLAEEFDGRARQNIFVIKLFGLAEHRSKMTYFPCIELICFIHI